MSPLLDKIITAVIGGAAGFAISWYVLAVDKRLLAVEDVNDYQGRTILEIIDHVKAIEMFIEGGR